jgi:hypothetical protein
MKWFTKFHANNDLEQGVILNSFPLPDLETIGLPLLGDGGIEIKYETYDVIVLTQTCDMAQNKVDRVHVCPVHTLKEYFDANPNKKSSQKSIKTEYDHLKSGRFVDKFLTNKCDSSLIDEYTDQYFVALFGRAVIVSRNYIDQFLLQSKRKNFLALNPPYRESLSQHYGRYFMRVGNPVDFIIKDEFDVFPFLS